MNGQALARIGRQARADKALDTQYSFDGQFMTIRDAIDSWKFINAEAKLITHDAKFNSIKPRIEYRLMRSGGSFVVLPKCAFDYLGQKLVKGYETVSGDFEGRLI